MKKRLIVPLLTIALLSPALAVSPAERLADPVQEQRARDISSQLRCVVCQNQSIDDSDADLAKDLRRIVRERITAGDNDDTVRQYLVQRYGEFVLLKPSFSLGNLLLWLTPLLALLIGFWLAWQYFRSRPVRAVPEAPVAELTREEQDEIDRLLKLRG